MMAHLVIVRHGKTEINEWNEDHPKDRMIGGQLESPLLPEGEQGAIDAGKGIAQMPWEIGLAVSSDLKRALRTRDLILAQLPGGKVIPACATSGLREIDYGDFAGRAEEDLRKEYPQFFDDPHCNKWRGDFDQKAPSGENYKDIDKRLKRELGPVLDVNPDNILIVSHLHIIQVLLYQLLGLTHDETCRCEIPNTRPIIIRRGNPNTLIGEVTLEKLLPNQKE